MNTAADFPELLSPFFTQYLMRREASPHTVASYRNTFRLLVIYAHDVLGKPPQELCFDDLGTDFLAGFPQQLESRRGNGARTRNPRLAAIRSLSRFIALREPRHAARAQQILAMPCKRTVRRPVDYLDRDGAEALLQAPDQNSWIGRRDYTQLLVALQTGLRASELITRRCENVHHQIGAHLRCHGKGRKDRVVPMQRDSVAACASEIGSRCSSTPGQAIAVAINQTRDLSHYRAPFGAWHTTPCRLRGHCRCQGTFRICHATLQGPSQ